MNYAGSSREGDNMNYKEEINDIYEMWIGIVAQTDRDIKELANADEMDIQNYERVSMIKRNATLMQLETMRILRGMGYITRDVDVIKKEYNKQQDEMISDIKTAIYEASTTNPFYDEYREERMQDIREGYEERMQEERATRQELKQAAQEVIDTMQKLQNTIKVV